MRFDDDHTDGPELTLREAPAPVAPPAGRAGGGLITGILVLAALTGSATGGLTIALDTLGGTYLARAAEIGLDPALLHRVAVIGAGSLDLLPHNGAVVSLLAVCGSTS